MSNQEDVLYKVLADLTLQEIKLQLPDFAFHNLDPKGYDQIFRDHQGNEWAYKANRIYQLNKQTKAPDKIFHFPGLLKYQILRIIQDQQGHYFITSWKNGVFRFFPEKNTLEPITTLPDHVYTDISEWSFKHQVWITCMDANFGLCLIHPATLTARKYSYIPGDPSSIQGSLYNGVFIDKKNNLWIASNAGINRISAEQNLYDIVPVTETGALNFQNDKNGPVYSFFETDSSIWLSKRFVSTLEYDTTFRLKKYYYSLYPPSSDMSTANGYAYYFYKQNHELYITTDSGLIVIDLDLGQDRHLFPPNDSCLYESANDCATF